MATSFGSAAAASVTENAHKSSPYLPLCHRHFFLSSNSHRISLRLSPRPKLRFSTKGWRFGWSYTAVVKAQLNQVAADGSSEAAASNPSDSEASKAQIPKDAKLASEESLSEFITQVSGLIKLVDSKDIVELQLKQHDCEILIRKKEALPPSPSTAFVPSQPQPAALPPVSTPWPVPSPAPTPAPSSSPSAPKAQPPKSSHPPLKSPMAGTFYRSPGPGEPPFVKADHSGTIVEILLDDGKPVSVDTPLFVIVP